MAKYYLENLYKEVLNYVYPEIQDLKFGILYEVLYIILDNEPQEAESICNSFGIKISGTKDDDEEIIDAIVGKPVRTMTNPINIFHLGKRELFWVVVVACILAGSIRCFQFIKRRKNQGKDKNTKTLQQPVALQIQPSTTRLQPLTVALCLVVPAYVVNEIKEQYSINAEEIEKLIDNASYFICKNVADAKLIEKRLNLTNENFSNIGERREVYVAIQIDDGQEILDKADPYILMRNLPSHCQGIVKQVACLRDLSGLEQFNRV